jgi:hypothetical protein
VERHDVPKLLEASNLNPYNIVIRLLLANALRQQGLSAAAQLNENESLRIDPGLQVSKELGRVF